MSARRNCRPKIDLREGETGPRGHHRSLGRPAKIRSQTDVHVVTAVARSGAVAVVVVGDPQVIIICFSNSTIMCERK